MFLRLFAVVGTVLLLFVGCQNMNEEGRRDTDKRDNTVQPTRYDDHNRSRQSDQRNRMDRDQSQNIDDRNINRVRNERDQDQANNEYDIAEEAAEEITDKLDEIDRSYVLTTRNNAYVAVTLDRDHRDQGDASKDNQSRMDDDKRGVADNEKTRNNRDNTDRRGEDHVSDELKSEIADIVRSVDDDIDNVYVSSNPDFVDLTNSYINDVNAGHPVRGFFDEIGDMIQRIFPQNR